MYIRVYSYFAENKLLTEHPILELIRNITKSFETNEYVLRVLMDIRKTFEIVNHEILLHKLKLHTKNSTCFFLCQNIYYNIQCTNKIQLAKNNANNMIKLLQTINITLQPMQ